MMARTAGFVPAAAACLLAGCVSSRDVVAPPSVPDDGSASHAPARPEAPMPRAGFDIVRGTEPGAVVSSAGTYLVAYEFVSGLPLNEPFGLRLQVTDRATGAPVEDGVELLVDGRMPHHRHGMLRVPVIRREAPGRFTVEGMQFHMIGYWELHFDLVRDGRFERAQIAVELD